MPCLLKNATHATPSATIQAKRQPSSLPSWWHGDYVRDSVLHILFPSKCYSCGVPMGAADNKRLCSSCMDQVNSIVSPLCIRCGAGLSAGSGCEDKFCSLCLTCQPRFDRARSLVYYKDPVRSLLHKLKFQADTRAAAALASVFSDVCMTYRQNEYDLIVPVPLFRSRLQKRGLNQALVLSQILFADDSKTIDPTALIRVRNTVAQTELSGSERRQNLKGAFKTNPKSDLAGKKICLVDDIYTTGTTVSECAVVLKRARASRVDVLTVARA